MMIYEHKKEFKISKMTLGTVQLGMHYGIANKTGKPSTELAFDILDAATKGGINSFDTANSYGRSEQVLGDYFSSLQYGPKDLLLTTKFKIDPTKGTDNESIEKQIFEMAEESLEKLNIEQIPIYMLHNPQDMLRYGDVVSKALRKLRDERILCKAGVSVYTLGEIEIMLENDIYEVVQLPINIFDLRVMETGLLNKLKKKGYMVFARSVFLQGLFFMEPEVVSQELPAAVDPLIRLREIACKLGISIAQLAVTFVRDIEGITSLVLGLETVEQLKENISMISEPPLEGKVKDELEELSRSVPIDLIMKKLTG